MTEQKKTTKSQILSISTKKGDAGKSFLANGQEYPKTHPVFTVLGSVDELNSQLGLVVAELRTQEFETNTQVITQLEHMQANLYLLSGILACSPKAKLAETELTHIEKLGINLQEQMSEGWTTQFLYPGGSIIGAHLDVARTICRRAERDALVLSELNDFTVPKVVLQYLNRLSDTLFIFRCYINSLFTVSEKKFSVQK